MKLIKSCLLCLCIGCAFWGSPLYAAAESPAASREYLCQTHECACASLGQCHTECCCLPSLAYSPKTENTGILPLRCANSPQAIPVTPESTGAPVAPFKLSVIPFSCGSMIFENSCAYHWDEHPPKPPPD